MKTWQALARAFALSSIFLMAASAAKASQSIECWDGDCLKNGWTVTDSGSGASQDFQCTRESCERNGWLTGGSLSSSVLSECALGGCFADGWFESDRWTHVRLHQIVCESGDCLKGGWTTYKDGGSVSITQCTEGDCRGNGWVTTTSGTQLKTVKCRQGDCFHRGWDQYP